MQNRCLHRRQLRELQRQDAPADHGWPKGSRYYDRRRPGQHAVGQDLGGFAFNGPSLTVDTACSSVLVALHLARRSIEAGERHRRCGRCPSDRFRHGASADGTCRSLVTEGHCLPFGAAADGTLLGEGVGVFLVASTDLAASRKWPELARIVATAVDSDGPTRANGAPPRRSSRSDAASMGGSGARSQDGPRSLRRMAPDARRRPCGGIVAGRIFLREPPEPPSRIGQRQCRPSDERGGFLRC